MNSISLVLKSFSEAPSIIKKAKLRKFYFFPGIIGIILLILIIFLANKFSNSMFNYIARCINLGKYSSFLFTLFKVIIAIAVFLFYFYIYKTVLIMIISPLLSYISEKVDNDLTQRSFSFSLKENAGFLGRGIHIGIICFIKQMIGTVILLVLGFFFPPLSLANPVLIFLLQGYFTGYSFMDYTLERYKFSTKESMIFLRKKRIYSVLSGTIFTLLLFIPFLGLFIAPLITCVAVTKITLYIMKNDNNYKKYITIE